MQAEGLFAVNSLGAKAEEVLITFEVLLCLDPKSAAKELLAAFGIASEAKNAHLETPSVGVLVGLNGTALGEVLTVGKSRLFVVDYLGSKGVSTVSECLEGANVKKHTLTSATNHGAPEPQNWNIEGGLMEFTSEIEVMDS